MLEKKEAQSRAEERDLIRRKMRVLYPKLTLMGEAREGYESENENGNRREEWCVLYPKLTQGGHHN